jgi:two-component system, cell cycle sensor histidine kinase and response regulator CckA
VLLVEPDAETRALAAFMLRRLGYRVAEAHNAPEALRVYDEQDGAFQLLLAEAIMPRVNGHDLTEMLRSRCPGLRVLLVADTDYERLARRAAARKRIGFLCRPFTMATLAVRVRESLDEGKTFAAGNPA